MAQQSSRLHRLLTLLDTGSTQATRFTAARQIGDIAKSHPQDLDSLLKKVSQYLHSKNWDTRVAAAHAIGSIAENVKHISFKELLACVEVEMVEAGNSNMAKDVVMGLPHFLPLTETALSFSSFDIRKVLEFGPPLLASVGQEYDIANDSKKNSIEGIARQKQKFRRRLGLDVCEQFMDVSDMVRDEDFLVHKVHPHGNGHGYYASQSRQHLPHSVANVVPNFYSKRLSAREMNLLKRKAKVNAKDHPKGWSEDDKFEAGYSQNPATPRGESQDSLDSNNKVLMEAGVDEVGLEQDGDGKWPFRHFVEQLILEMFDPIWEVRHGSVMALREILTHQAASAGVDMPDLSIGSSCLVEVEDKPNNVYNTAKRSREFDLNVQFGVGDSEPCTKRLKSEKESSVFVSSVASPDVCLKIEDVSCASSGLVMGEHHMGPGPVKSEPVQFLETSHFDCEDVEDIPEKIIASEDQSSNLKMGMATNLLSSHVSGDSTGLVMGELHTGPVKSEPDQFLEPSHFDSKEVEDIAEQKVACEDHSSNSKMGMTMNLQEGSKLMRLVKLGRNSWIRNCEFLQDCAIRFLCILLLDRFGDYVSDQVVAPVRETCAQALGVVLKYMHPASVHETLNVLLQMQCRQEWEIRHGSLLGIKYLVAVRREMLPELLPCVLPACKIGLEDADDDVRAVAAEALLPTAAAIVSLKGQTLRSIVMLLWDILLDLDDLSPSTSSVMNLLAEIYSQPEMVPKMLGALEKQELDLNEVVQADELGDGVNNEQNPYILATLAPRLWPFMRHSITSVRHAAIRTLERLLEAGCRKSLSEPISHSFWPVSILGDTLRIVFQNMLLESNDEILQCSDRVWRLLIQCPESDLDAAARSYMSSWIQLATTPYGSTLDATKMFWPLALPRKSHFRAAAKMRAVKLDNQATQSYGFDSLKDNIFQDRSEISNLTKIVVGADSQKSVTHTRVATATALGILASKLPETSLPFVVDTLWNDLTSLSGVQRQVASMVLIAWFRELKNKGIIGIPVSMLPSVDNVRKWLLDLLACTDPSLPTKDSNLPYLELSRTYTKMRNEASQLFRLVDSSDMFKSLLSTVNFDPDAVSVDDAISFASKLSTLADHSTGREPSETHIPDDMESLKQRLLSTSGYLKCVQGNLHITVSALVAAAVIWMSELPMRLNPIILPLMAAIKREQEEILQQKAAEALAELISHCIARRPSPNDKLIKNLCSLICMDPCETPQAALINSMDIIEDHDLLSFGREAAGNNQKTKVQVLSAGEDRSRVEGFISRRGAEFALKHLCEKFGGTLFDKLPKLWDYLTEVLKPCTSEGLSVTDDQVITQIVDSMKDLQALINNIQVVRSIAPMVDETLKPKLLTLLPFIFGCVRHRHVAVRLAASRCIASMAKSMTASVMGLVIEKVIPMLGDTVSVHARQGAGMLVSLLVQGLGVELVPYATLLVVPLLGCMSDSDHAVRQSVTHSFAALVPLLPLARGLPPPVGLSEGLYKNAEDARFLEQLLDNSHIDDYKLSTELKVTLRRYQQEGINWLSFLRRFKLHGILCDDMGLGKTLQASAIVASDIAERRAKSNDKDFLSLIICPSTLVGHWAYEIEKYIDVSIITPLQYMGSVQDRTLLRDQFGKYNVIITSYDVIRKDIDYLGKLAWNYCILDEGHIIKNSKSKITSAVKQLKAEHRLILSGTPIQNNVLELWSLFDFLMPGFLGTERQFQATYGKPLVAARDPKCSAKDAEAGALAMEALHKQVMPFLLRRTKDEVLSDLPEKIIQDRYCDLSPIQLKLYEQFSGSDVRQEISTLVEVTDTPKTVEVASPSPKASSHVFQALQYLLKLCSHPLLVLGEKPPDSIMRVVSEVIPGSANLMLDLHELHHSPKLVALREILEECGVGWNASSSEGVAGVGQHRVLIFAQHKSFLDIIERDLFQTHMKSVTYLRLDGSVEPEKRFDIVKAFNSDPTIDVLLLTTHVGGLGLNLTSADTLVFMEHDWNPMRDHQAMDRAHRLGQRKVVNVHRLIMRGTLEEKVMSLQKFKVSIANAVINAENTSMKTMNTDQLLDLFTSAQTITKGPAHSKNSNSTFDEVSKSVTGGKGLKAILTGLEELWDHSQYTEEYNLSQFLAKLND